MINIDRISNYFINSFSIDLEPGTLAPSHNLEQVRIFRYYRLPYTVHVLSFQLECQPGESCVSICTTDPCSNNGTCIQRDAGFTCVCMGDFTGDTCETRIESADTTTATVTDATTTSNNITDATTTSNNATDSTTTSNSNNSKLKRRMVGAMCGSIITFVIISIIIISIIIITVLLRRRRMAKSSIGKSLRSMLINHLFIQSFAGWLSNCKMQMSRLQCIIRPMQSSRLSLCGHYCLCTYLHFVFDNQLAKLCSVPQGFHASSCMKPCYSNFPPQVFIYYKGRGNPPNK